MNRQSSLKRQRRAFTIIELLAAMLAATVLLAGLAASVSIATSLLDLQADEAVSDIDDELRNRIAMDLRHSTVLTDVSSSSVSLERVEPMSGLAEQITYTVSSSGLSRSTSQGATEVLDSRQPVLSIVADNYSVPSVALPKRVRWRATSTAVTDGSTSLTVGRPPGCVSGDLVLLCIAGKFGDSSINLPSGWNTIGDVKRSTLGQIVCYQYFSPANTSSVVITTPSSIPFSAIMLSISDAHPYNPVSFTSTESRFAWSILGPHPNALEPGVSNPSRMVLQILATEDEQWGLATFRMPSYVDAAHLIANPGSGRQTISQGVTLRNGIDTEMSASKVTFCSRLGNWVQTAVELEVAP